jgi:hypothetical protein
MPVKKVATRSLNPGAPVLTLIIKKRKPLKTSKVIKHALLRDNALKRLGARVGQNGP